MKEVEIMSNLRFRTILVALILLVTVTFNTALANADTTEQRMYTFAGSTSSGSYYFQTVPVASLFESLDFVKSVTVEATNGAAENALLINSGAADLGLVSLSTLGLAQIGADPFSNVLTELSSICYTAGSAVLFMVKANSDIHSLNDLKGRSLATSEAGAAGEVTVRTLLNANGIMYEDLSHVQFLGNRDSLAQLIDGKVDAVMFSASVPNSTVTDISLTNDLRFIGFKTEEMQKFSEAYSGFKPGVIPAGIFKGQDEELTTAISPTVLVVNRNIPDDVVYAMTKLLFESMDKLAEGNLVYRNWSFSTDYYGIVELHPGARAYYQEAGLVQ